MSNSFRRKISVLRCLVLSFCLLGGCRDESKNQDSGSPAELPFADTSLVVFVPQSADDSERWSVILSEWMARSGATCEVRSYDDQTGFESCSDAWKESDSDASIVIFPRSWLGEAWHKKLLSNIPDDLQSIEELNWRDIHPNLADACYQWEKQPSVLPIREPLLLTYYRSDLLEAAGLQPPESWDDYQELVSTVETWAPGLKAVEPWGETFRTSMFLARSMPYVKTRGNYSVFLDYNTEEPLIASPGFVKGLQESRDVQQWLAPGSNELSPDDCLAELASGRAAIGIASAFPRVARTLPPSSDRDIRWGVVPLPGANQFFEPGRQEWITQSDGSPNRVTLTGWEGLLVGVLAGGTDRAERASWNLLHSLLVEVGRDAFAPGRMTATRLSTSRTAVVAPLDGLDFRQFTDAVTNSFREAEVVPVLVMTKRELFLKALDKSVNRILAGESEPQAALDELALEWKTLLDQEGKQELINSYRGGLGVRKRIVISE